jgi:hypothetical protein
MSRTDKTKPWWVRVNEHNPRADHDHRNGICDLPESALSQHNNFQWNRSQCHWSDHEIIYGNCCAGCGCVHCRDAYSHRRSVRTERHSTKQALRAMRTTVTDDNLDKLTGRRRDFFTVRGHYEIPMCDAGRRLCRPGALWSEVCTQVSRFSAKEEHLDQPWRFCRTHMDAYRDTRGNRVAGRLAG